MLKLLVKNYQNTQDIHVRMRYGLLEGWLSIIVNILLFLLKFFIGVAINSISLLADSFHTLSDSFTSIVVITSFKMSARPPDREHPFGHGRIESIASIVIAVLLGVVGVNFLYQSSQRLIMFMQNRPEIVAGSYLAMLIMGLSVLIKEAMARFSINLGDMIKSQSLKADGWHHRTDAIASVFVLFAIAAARFNVLWLDPIMGIGVSLLIIKVGVDVLRESSKMILGGVDEKEIAKLEKIIREIPGCDGVHKISIYDYGSSKIISMHVEVSEDASFRESHHIADMVEKEISRRLGKNVTAVVHADPKFVESKDMTEDIVRIVLNQKGVIGTHKMQMLGGKERMMIFHIQVDPDMSVKESHEITRRLKKKLKNIFDGTITIHVEPCNEKCETCAAYCKKPAKRIKS